MMRQISSSRQRRWIHGVLCAVVVAGGPARAETPQPFPQFTFKRVGLPSAGSTSRITVQIDPAEQAAILSRGRREAEEVVEDGAPEVAAAVSGWEWFWDEVSPSIDTAGPGKLSQALSVLRDNPGQSPAPRLQDLQNIAESFGTDILRATVGTDVSPALVLAVIAVESGGRIEAESGAGAQGLMQLMPDTAERFGVEDSAVAAQNIAGGVKYLSWLLSEFDSDPLLALAGYNAGENAVHRNGGVPPYAETRGYVPKVLSAWQVARGLCLTPPELISDGCVFAVKGPAANG